MSPSARAVVVAFALVAGAGTAGAQDRLAAVRSHYGAAEYEAALDLLASGTTSDAVEADRLRALCLLALGRSAEADAVIERVVVARPNYEPASEASPRVRGAFRVVRARVLPAFARQLYESGKAAFERRAFSEAAAIFEQALPVLELLALEGRMDMEGLRVLTTDFLWLSRRLVPPPVQPLPLLQARTLTVAASLPAASPRVDPLSRAR